jgi:hypothetical protein
MTRRWSCWTVSPRPSGPGGEFADKPGTSQKMLSAKDQRKADFASFQAKQKAQAAVDDPILAAAGLSRSDLIALPASPDAGIPISSILGGGSSAQDVLNLLASGKFIRVGPAAPAAQRDFTKFGDAMEEYVGSGAFVVNSALRKSKGVLDDLPKRSGTEDFGFLKKQEITDIASTLDKKIAASAPFKKETLLYRAVTADTFKKLKPGSTLTDHGFTSTANHPNVSELEHLQDEPLTLMRIRAPKGTRALNVDAALPGHEFAVGEFVLPRSNTLRYVGPGKDGFLDFELVLG